MGADIFIIGSEASVNDQIRNVLETVGYEIETFSDFEAALSALDPQRTSLVFLDTGLVAFELGEDIDRIQAISSNIEFILIAEYQDPLVEEEAKSHGVDNWLYRPFTAPEIILKVASCLEMASSVGEDGVAKDGEPKGKREESATESGE